MKFTGSQSPVNTDPIRQDSEIEALRMLVRLLARKAARQALASSETASVSEVMNLRGSDERNDKR